MTKLLLAGVAVPSVLTVSIVPVASAARFTFASSSTAA
jgi:hypothetical protein